MAPTGRQQELTDGPRNPANETNRTYISAALGALFACRVGHAEFGLFAHDSAGPGRPVGFYGTQAVLAFLAGYSAYLVKGYWQT